MIDCALERGCYLFKIHGTPSIKLVMGNNVRYWADTGERGANGWSRFIDSHIGPNLRQIFTDEELEAAKEEPTDGGTTFYLESPSLNHSWVEELRKLSREFRIYNDTFVFRVNNQIHIPKLHAFRSKYCDKVFSGFKSSIRHFVNTNKFGVMHRYDYEEMEALIATKRAVLLIANKKVMFEQKMGLVELSKDHCNDDIEIGYAIIDDKDNAKINSLIKGPVKEMPYLYSINIHHPKKNKYIGRIADATKNGFVPTIKTLGQAMKENYEYAFIYIGVGILWVIALCYFLVLFIFSDKQLEIQPSYSKYA